MQLSLSEPGIWLLQLFQVFYTILSSALVDATEIDNGVEGEPSINCGEDQISFWVKTRKPFSGKIYVKGEYNNPDCINSYVPGSGISQPPTRGPAATGTPPGAHSTTSPSGLLPGSTFLPSEGTRGLSLRPETCPPCPSCPAGGNSAFLEFRDRRQQQNQTNADEPKRADAPQIVIKMAYCNLKRERQLNPKGMAVQFTVVVSFHQNFITKVDRAYQVRCFYMEGDKTVSSELDVSMPQTTELQAQAAMPVCEYSIRRDSPTGPQIRYAKVGDKTFHVWECKTEVEVFGMLVHNCFVDDGQGQKVPVLTEKGCSLDKYVIGDLTYQTPLLASVESHVFKFADKPVLDFQCAISICIREGGECSGITPPSCSKKSRRELGLKAINNRSTAWPAVQVGLRPDQWDVHAQRMVVVDLDDDISSEKLIQFEQRASAARDHDGHMISEDLFQENSRDNISGLSRLSRALQSAIASNNVCLSVWGFGFLVGLCTFMFTIAAVILGATYVLRRSKSVHNSCNSSAASSYTYRT